MSDALAAIEQIVAQPLADALKAKITNPTELAAAAQVLEGLSVFLELVAADLAVTAAAAPAGASSTAA